MKKLIIALVFLIPLFSFNSNESVNKRGKATLQITCGTCYANTPLHFIGSGYRQGRREDIFFYGPNGLTAFNNVFFADSKGDLDFTVTLPAPGDYECEVFEMNNNGWHTYKTTIYFNLQ